MACVAELLTAALSTKKEKARYAYIAPFYAQAKAVAWDYLKSYGEKAITSISESELSVTLQNGAAVRLYGADNPNALRGIYLDGVVMDEMADMRPAVWGEIIRPALSDRKGWAIFIGTPRGHNAFYDLYRQSTSDPSWFSLVLKASETGVHSPEELEDARKGMTADQYEQEFECSFEAAIQGAVFAQELQKANIVAVPHAPELPVDTWWDLGVSDSTAIIFTQTALGGQLRLIDYYEASGEGLPHYAQVLDGKGYTYRHHWAPHDIQVRELGSGRSRIETAAALGIRFQVVPNIPLHDGINAARLLLPRCWIDQTRCRPLIEALQNYRWDYNDKLGEFKSRPLHDWASHAADSFRYLAVGHKERPERKTQRPVLQAGGWMG